MARTKIAIACQGGGSQTAFTAGVLKALCEANLQDQFEFVGISGTSGGALCATLVWYALRRGEQPIWRRLIEFWRDNTAQSGPERMINNTIIDWLRMVNRSRCLTGELKDSAVRTPTSSARWSAYFRLAVAVLCGVGGGRSSSRIEICSE